MSTKEYFRLAKLSLKQRKKTTITTIVGLAFGFIILIPMIVAFFGVNISLNNQLNNNTYLLYGELSMADYRISTEDLEFNANGYANLSGSKHLDEFLSCNNITDKIVYENYQFRWADFGESEFYCIDDGKKQNIPLAVGNNFSVIDLDKSSSIFPNNLMTKFKGDIFVDNCNQGFSDNGKKQVIISENLLQLYGLKAQDVYQKNLTISKKYLNTTSFLCKNYKIVGIIKSEVSNIYGIDELMNSNLFFTSCNVYNNNEGVLKPHYKNINSDIKEIVFDNLKNIDKLNEEYMMLNWNAPQNNSFNSQTFASTKIYFESNSYKNTNQVVSKFTKDITKIFDKESDYVSTSTVFEKFKTIYGVANIVSILFIVVGIVLICSSLINLYDTIYHSVNQQKYYLTMLRAIGAKRCVIPKLYCAESLIIASWANLFIIIFGTTFSIIVKVIVDLMLKIKNVYYNLSISWFSVFAGTIIAVIILYAVTLLFSFVCTKKLSNKKITEILNEK